jgi:hypothetical protein
MYGVAKPVGLEREEAESRMFFEAFGPAVRWAVETGVPLDTARDVLISAVMAVAGRRWPDLNELAVALDRTPRSVRMLLKNPDPCIERRGINLLERAWDLIEQAPRTADEISAHLPVLEGFDSGRVALAALLRTGRAEPVAERGGPTRYRPAGEPRIQEASPEATGRLAGLKRHLAAVGQALRGGRRTTTTAQVRANPSDFQAFLEEVEAFVQRRGAELEAAAGDDAVEVTVYLGGAPSQAD